MTGVLASRTAGSGWETLISWKSVQETDKSILATAKYPGFTISI
jgi:hypothetical protein